MNVPRRPEAAGDNRPPVESGTLNPPFLLKPAGVQTALASAGMRAWGKNPMLDAARETDLCKVQ